MLVGDYCPRALDPIIQMIDTEHELEVAKQALDVMTEASVRDTKAGIVPAKPIHGEPVAELPCNVFGTVDRCDGMGCEHDGNCFSGCCSLSSLQGSQSAACRLSMEICAPLQLTSLNNCRKQL